MRWLTIILLHNIVIASTLSAATCFIGTIPSKQTPFVTAARYSSLNAAATVDSATTTSSPSLDVFVRFSPLVGGPRFLPLHVEVVLQENHDGGIAISADDSNDDPGAAAVRHRFDFLPSDPTSLDTTVRMATLRPVSGLVRYRLVDARSTENGNNYGDVVTNDKLDRSMVRIGSSESTVVSALHFCEEYRSTKSQLKLLTNNCFTFAVDLLRSLNVDFQL